MSPRIPSFEIPDRLQDPDSLKQNEHLEFAVLAGSVGFNIFVGILGAIFFLSFRTTDVGFRYLTPRRYVWPEKMDQATTDTLLKKPKSFFSWVLRLWSWDEESLIRGAGYDAVVLFRVLRCCFRIVFCYSFYALIVLLPVNYSPYNGSLLRETRKGKVDRPELFDDDSLSFAVYGNITAESQVFYEFTIANIQPGDHISLLAHLLGVIGLAMTVIYFLHIELTNYLILRAQYLGNHTLRLGDEPPHEQHLKAVVVEDIPEPLRHPVTLKIYFDLMYPGAIEKVIMVNNTTQLQKLVKVRDGILNKLEHTLLQLHVSVHSLRRDGQAWYYKRAFKLQKKLVAANDALAKEIQEVKKIRKSSAETENETAIDEVFTFLGSGESSRLRTRSTVEISSFETRMRKRSTMMPSNSKHLGDTSDDSDEDHQEQPLLGGGSGGGGAEPSAENIDGPRKSPKLGRSVSFKPSSVPVKQVDLHAPVDNGSSGTSASEIELANVPKKSMSQKAAAREEHKVMKSMSLEERASPLKQAKHVLLGSRTGAIAHRQFGSKAFVVFKRFAEATLAQQVITCKEPGLMKVSPCPDKEDCFLDADNWILTQAQLAWRKFFVGAIMLFIILLFIIPATALSILCSDNGRSHLMRNKGIQSAAENSNFVAAVLSYVHPMVLIAVINLLPPIMTGLGLFEGSLTWSHTSMKQLDRFLGFLLVNVLFVTTISGAITDTARFIISSEPRKFFMLMGAALPRMSAFFLQYLVVKATIGLSMEINRGLAGLQMLLRWLCWLLLGVCPDITEKDRKVVFIGIRRWNNPGWLPFGKVYANILLVMVISLVYAIMAPMVLIGGVMWFSYSQIVYRHSLLFVYEARFETGGNFFPMVFRRMLYMLLISQATMVGIFILKGVEMYALVTIVVMGVTIYYTFYMTEHYTSLNRLPLELAVSFDLEESSMPEPERKAQLRKSLGPRNDATQMAEFNKEQNKKRRSSASGSKNLESKRRPTIYFDSSLDGGGDGENDDDDDEVREKDWEEQQRKDWEEQQRYQQFIQPELMDSCGAAEGAVAAQIAPRKTSCYGPAKLMFSCKRQCHESAHRMRLKLSDGGDDDSDCFDPNEGKKDDVEAGAGELDSKVDKILTDWGVNAGAVTNDHDAWRPDDSAYLLEDDGVGN